MIEFSALLAETTASAQGYFVRGQVKRKQLKIPEAIRLFTFAEHAGYNADRCAAERWICHMLGGCFEDAWNESDAITKRGKPDTNRFWDGRPIRGRSVLIRCLHGLGDTIQFVRYAPLIREQAKDLSIEAQPSLKPLLQQAGVADQVITWGEAEPPWNQQVEIMEVPRIFRTTIETIPQRVPYLDVRDTPFCEPYDRTRQLRVGLVWASSDYNMARSISLDCIAALFEVLGTSFFSLQSGPERQQLVSYSCKITDLEAESESILAAAKTLKHLDLVISVDTMIAHLAGALGRPTWTLLPYECDWRWMLNREDSPWYPTMRLFRQPQPGDWQPVVQHVKRELGAVVKTGRLNQAQL